MVAPAPTRVSNAEFLNRPDEQAFAELRNGVFTMVGGANIEHQLICGNIYVLLRGLVTSGLLLQPPFDVVFREGEIAQPDVFWIADKTRVLLKAARLDGAPDFVVEVLSPSTGSYDKNGKKRLYERYGVREYWIVDIARREVAVYRLTDGVFADAETYKEGQTIEQSVIGATIALNSVFDIG